MENINDSINVNPMPLENIPVQDGGAVSMQPLENNYGIENTLSFVLLLISIIKVARDIKDSGKKFSYWDLLKFIPVIKQGYSSISGIAEIPKELSDKITDEEFQKIADAVKELGIEDKDIEATTIEVLQWVISTKNLLFKRFIK